MGRYNFAPQRVHQAASRLLQQGQERVAPPWYHIVGTLPPSERLVRPPLQPAQRKGRKASKLFKPIALEYQEDKLRFEFFGDHPWELARPRQILEEDGKDYQKFDWSQLEQSSKQVDGESVVQRQAWLMGLHRHEIDFPANDQLRAYLRSRTGEDQDGPLVLDLLQDYIKSEYALDMECIVPNDDLHDPNTNVRVTAHFTYHPKHPHQLKDGLNYLIAELSEQGLDQSTINMRTYNLSLPKTTNVSRLQRADQVAAIQKQFNINITLQPVLTISPFGEQPFDVQPITLSYHRNASPNVADLISHLTTLTDTSPSDVLRPALPSADPDTYSAYTKLGAYDKARKEFYDVRHAQEIELRVAREEAVMTGAEFGPSPLDIGMQLEDQTYEAWRAWAEKEITAVRQLTASGGTGVAETEESQELDDPELDAVADEVEPEVPGTKRGQQAQGGALLHP